jgi:surface protein
MDGTEMGEVVVEITWWDKWAGFEPFEMTWETTGGNQTLSLPLMNGQAYDFEIAWGDGLTGKYTASNLTTASHLYVDTGTYQIRVWGTFPQISFNNTGNKLNLLSIDQWGSIEWKSFANAFRGASNLDVLAEDIPHMAEVTGMAYMFAGTAVSSGNFVGWDTSNVVDMSYLFQNATKFNQPLGSWEVSNVTTMQNMFNGASVFDQNLSNWQLSSIPAGSKTALAGMLVNTNLSTYHYNALLGSLAQQDVATGITLDATPAWYGGCSVSNAQLGVDGWYALTRPVTNG